MCVGRLLIVVEAVTSPRGNDAHGELDIQPPTTDVESMDAVVAELSVSPMPEPMPVVMDAVVVIGQTRGRSLPEIIIERRRRVGLFTDPQ